jgi:hypothetical protein
LVGSAADVVNELAVAIVVVGSGKRDEHAADEQALPLLQRVTLAVASLRQRRELAQGLGRQVERLTASARRRAPPVAALAMLAAPLLLGVLLVGLASGGQHPLSSLGFLALRVCAGSDAELCPVAAAGVEEDAEAVVGQQLARPTCRFTPSLG